MLKKKKGEREKIENYCFFYRVAKVGDDSSKIAVQKDFTDAKTKIYFNQLIGQISKKKNFFEQLHGL